MVQQVVFDHLSTLEHDSAVSVKYHNKSIFGSGLCLTVQQSHPEPTTLKGRELLRVCLQQLLIYSILIGRNRSKTGTGTGAGTEPGITTDMSHSWLILWYIIPSYSIPSSVSILLTSKQHGVLQIAPSRRRTVGTVQGRFHWRSTSGGFSADTAQVGPWVSVVCRTSLAKVDDSLQVGQCSPKYREGTQAGYQEENDG